MNRGDTEGVSEKRHSGLTGETRSGSTDATAHNNDAPPIEATPIQEGP